MNELRIFENRELGKVRVVEIKNEPWFVVADVCRILELSNPTVTLQISISKTPKVTGKGQIYFINKLKETGIKDVV